MGDQDERSGLDGDGDDAVALNLQQVFTYRN